MSASLQVIKKYGELLSSQCVLLCVLFLLLWSIPIAYVWGMTIDDAGISYAYAMHLADGQGLTYAPGGYRVEGYSNPLWVALLTPVAWAGLPINEVSKALGALLGGLALFGASLVGQRMEGRGHQRWIWRDLVPWGGVCVAEFAMWMQGGLENGLYAFLMVLGVYLVVWERDDPGRRPWSAAVALGLVLTRPDGVMYAVILGGFKFLTMIAHREQRRGFVRFVFWSMAGLGVYMAWHWWMFRDLVPNTYYAKKPGGLAPSVFEPGIAYVTSGIDAMGWSAPLGLCVVGLLKPNLDRILLFGMVAAGFFFAATSGGDWMPGHRFLSYGVPLIALGAHQGVERLWRLAKAFGRPGHLLGMCGGVGVLAATLCYVSAQADRVSTWHWRSWDQLGHVLERAQGVKRQAKLHGLGHVSVLTHDFGGMAMEADGAMLPIDYLGLCDPLQARANQWAKGDVHDMAQKMYETYVWGELERSPDFIYLPPMWWRRLETFEEFKRNYMMLGNLEQRIGKGQGGGLYLAIARSAWIHFYPPLAKLKRQALGGQLTLLGAQHDGLTLGVALLKERGGIEAVALRQSGGAQLGRPHYLFGHNARLLDQWERGEPYWLEVRMGGGEGPWELGLKEVGKSTWTWHRIDVRAVSRHQALPREPSSLAGPRNAELLAQHERLLTLHESRQDARDWSLVSPGLTRELMDLAQRLEGHDRYMALVWALQSDRTKSPLLYKHLLKARTSLGTQDHWTTERELLTLLHQSGDPVVARVLYTWLRRRSLELKASWVMGRFHLGPEPLTQWESPFVGADFESGGWGMWEVEGEAFGPRPQGSSLSWTSRNPGRQGHFVASSFATVSNAAKGTLRSPRFRLSGAMVGLLVAGGQDEGVGVELLVDDQVIASAKGDRSPSFRRVWWDVRAWQGKVATLKVRDDSVKGWGWVAIDDLVVAGPQQRTSLKKNDL